MGCAIAASSGSLRATAPEGVQSITTTFTTGTNTTSEKLDGKTVTTDNDQLSVVTIKDTSGNTYTVAGEATTAIIRTDSADAHSNSTAWYMGNAGSTTPSTLYGTYNSSNPASLLLGNNLLEGADNVFANSSSTTSAETNVERIDFLYAGTTGVVDNNNLAIGVFDLGTGASFSVAVITSVDSLGNPTGYEGFEVVNSSAFTGGSLLTTATANSTILNSSSNPSDYLVRYDSSTSLATGNSDAFVDNNDNVTGVVITLASLGIASGTKIYGYSLMGGDVTPGTNFNSLTNTTNASVFPTTTSDSFGDLDPAAVNGVMFSMQAVPEPSTYAEVLLTAALALWGLQRRRGQSGEEPKA